MLIVRNAVKAAEAGCGAGASPASSCNVLHLIFLARGAPAPHRYHKSFDSY
jgi:hypothetical protein